MKLKLNQTDYWNKVANKKNFTHPINWDYLKPVLNQKSNILDYGCGYGRLTNEISKNGYENVIGVDNAEAMVGKAKINFPDVNFEQNNIESIRFSDNEFDSILLFAVLTCIPLSSDQESLIKELKRVLSPNGILYVSDYLINPDARNMERYKRIVNRPFGIFEHREGVILRHHSLDYLHEFVFAGFDILNEKIYEVTSMNGNKSKAVQIIGKKRNANNLYKSLGN